MCPFEHACQTFGCAMVLYNFCYTCGPPGIDLRTPQWSEDLRLGNPDLKRSPATIMLAIHR